MRPQPPLSVSLPTHLHLLRSELMRHAACCYPTTCAAEREDAVQETLTQLHLRAQDPSSTLCTAWARDGLAGVRRYAFRVVWYLLRGFRRRRGSRWDRLPLELSGGERPDELLAVQQATQRLAHAVRVAGRRFLPRAPTALEAALAESLCSDAGVSELAAQHGLRREPLSRARSWVRQQTLLA